ncbi:MAG: ABC transporter ATP-binding protein [candidate division WOR-3 bacterium]|nr:MAG: ABC transporter ATP-binding protein [candidate division WOR-3 bacterium]
METSITLKNITRSFKTHFWEKEKEVLRGISLEVYKGEVFGFLGPNGAGKTTTIKIITGLIRPDSGTVSIFGNPADSLEAKKRIGFLPESPFFYEHLTGFEFLKIHALLSNYKDCKKAVIESLHRLGLKEATNLPLRKYSRGMLQRIGICQALIGNPDLLILDEPLTGLDPIGRKEIKDLILEEKAKGKTIFFSSHILPDAEAVCDRIGIIIDGEIMQVGNLAILLKKDVKTDEISLEDWFFKQVKGSPVEIRDKL